MTRLNDFHAYCSNVVANQEVLQFSQTAGEMDQQPLDIIQDEFIELSDYSIKTNYIVTLSQNVTAQQQHQSNPILTATEVDGTLTQPIVAHIDISLKTTEEDVKGTIGVTNVPPKNRVPKSKSSAGRRRTGKKMVSRLVTEGQSEGKCDGETELQSTDALAKDHVGLEIVELIEKIDDDFDDDEADDVIEPVVYESHEQFAGFPKVIIKDSRLHIRGSALLDLMSRYNELY